MADRDPVSLPAEVRAKLAELELELSEGEYLNFTAELARSLARSLCPGSVAACGGGGRLHAGGVWGPGGTHV